MDHETMRSLIGTILLWAMAIAAAAWLIWKNRELIREICLDENGKFDPLGGLERYFARGGQGEEPEPDTVTADAHHFPRKGTGCRLSIPGDVCCKGVRSDRMGGEPAGRFCGDGGAGDSRRHRPGSDSSSQRALDPH